jgi:hypothetical protein
MHLGRVDHRQAVHASRTCRGTATNSASTPGAIGDLVMALDAIRDHPLTGSGAQIDLVVGSWNAALAVGGAERRPSQPTSRWLAREATTSG